MGKAFDELLSGMIAGRAWKQMGDPESVRQLLWAVYEERYHKADHHKSRYQLRVNLQKKDDAASYAGFITAENPTSGAYQGTSFVWMPGTEGSIAVLVIGTDGFGADTHILGRPGHARRLRALARLHNGKIWVKPDLLDVTSQVPEPIIENWPDQLDAVSKAYGKVIYAAVPVRSNKDSEAVEDLLDLFFSEHDTPLTSAARQRWNERHAAILGAIFPQVELPQVLALLRERRFVILEGPPGTGKTRLAYEVARQIGQATRIQFHPARTYEDFVVGLYPKPAAGGLAFEVRLGDFLRANKAAETGEHVLLIDEVNRADLSRVLGEAIVLLEPGEQREIELPHRPDGWNDRKVSLASGLHLLATRNTADRTIARMDLAVRRRFAFLEMWPDRRPVDAEGVPLAIACFNDVLDTFTEFADEEALKLIPGHAYFLDPRHDQDAKERGKRIARRLDLELIPLLREYLSERLTGSASQPIAGLTDRIASRLQEERAA
ncbi:McrB family protein [Corallococcus exiguus]|uniref:AAA domain-containing protein n=1 Tax=Corallococcus exiguus TaxID=83462 RepID=A0A7X4Y9V7_9BACT|nr:AAA family ATPase [Corallococcus exiguus]NBC41306.1 AAA domain-containing protein [Corallococcus exiguus]TNV66921.1 AAA family ATPase [Corallococcus exiguus]